MSTFTQTTLVRYARWVLVAASVAVTAACGGGGGGGGAPSSSPSGNIAAQSVESINLTINASRTTGVAPLAISFDALGTTASTLTSLPFHEIQYTWNFGDSAGGAKWVYGAKAGVANKNSAYGPVAAHIFETPGIYTVSLKANHGSYSADRTLTVTVQDPAVAFANSTLYVSNTATPSPGVDGVPIGANVQFVSSFASFTALSNVYKRILLKRGEVWNTAASTLVITSGNSGLLGAYGSGAKPVIQLNTNDPAIRLTSTANDWRIVDIDITAPSYIGTSQRGVVVAGAKNTLMLRMDIGPTWFGLQSDSANGLYFVDSYIRDSWDGALAGSTLGIWAGKTNNLAILGSRVSRVGGEHGVRLQGAEKAIVSNSQLDTAARNVLTIRGNSNDLNLGNWNGFWTENVVVSDCIIDNSSSSGLFAVMHAGPMNVQSAERLRNVLIERNIIKGKSFAPVEINVSEAVTLRNNLIIATGFYSGIVLGNGSSVTPPPSGSYIYDNSIYKPDASMVDKWSAILLTGSASRHATGTVVKNNLSYAPGNNKTGGWDGNAASFIYIPDFVPPSAYVLEGNSTDEQVNTINVWGGDNPQLADKPFIPTGYALVGRAPIQNWDDFESNPRYDTVSKTFKASIGALAR